MPDASAHATRFPARSYQVEKKPRPFGTDGDFMGQARLLSVISRLRIGLSTNKANATTTKFITAVTANTMCQLPVAVLIMLATGTRKAEVPFAVYSRLRFTVANFAP